MPSRSLIPQQTDVLVVGAGPVGLTLAATLQQAGLNHLLVDRLPGGANESRACIVHARTLEVLEELDVTRRLLEVGVRTPRFTLHDGSRRLGAIDFSTLDTAYPFALMVPQNITESILSDRLTELGRSVHRPWGVTKVRDDGSSVAVRLEADGASREVVAQYVVGADGSHSIVREQAGIAFEGATYPESFVLADVRLTGVPRDEVQLHLSRDGVTVLAPLPGERHRIVATMGRLDEGVETPEHPDLGYVQRVLDARVAGSRASDLGWSSRFLVHHRLADRYRAGRVLLAGDAAHVHSPAGGQGMNTGIQDAVVLGASLAAALKGDDDALDHYERVRRPVAEQVVSLTDRMTRMATLRARPARAVRDLAMHTLLGIPGVNHRLAHTAAELDHR